MNEQTYLVLNDKLHVGTIQRWDDDLAFEYSPQYQKSDFPAIEQFPDKKKTYSTESVLSFVCNRVPSEYMTYNNTLTLTRIIELAGHKYEDSPFIIAEVKL